MISQLPEPNAAENEQKNDERVSLAASRRIDSRSARDPASPNKPALVRISWPRQTTDYNSVVSNRIDGRHRLQTDFFELRVSFSGCFIMCKVE